MACADKNECLNLLDNNCTESGKICFNTVGSFECRTPPMTYELIPSLAKCPIGSGVSIEDCLAAGQSVGGTSLKYSGPSFAVPCGCYLSENDDGIYFNTSTTGCAPIPALKSVCKIN